jgi:hypothetical protein
MSDFSSRFCRRCRQEEFACDCAQPDFFEPMINYVLRKELPPHDHPWFDDAQQSVPRCRDR